MLLSFSCLKFRIGFLDTLALSLLTTIEPSDTCMSSSTSSSLSSRKVFLRAWKGRCGLQCSRQRHTSTTKKVISTNSSLQILPSLHDTLQEKALQRGALSSNWRTGLISYGFLIYCLQLLLLYNSSYKLAPVNGEWPTVEDWPAEPSDFISLVNSLEIRELQPLYTTIWQTLASVRRCEDSKACTHDLSHAKPPFLEHFPERLPELVGSQHCSPNSESAFLIIGVVPPEWLQDMCWFPSCP